jgi:protein tyrosine/serine phosphatase
MASKEAQAVNFREIRVGSIAPNTLYRSSHPILDDKQTATISLLAANTRIAAVLNLSDTGSELKTKAFFAPWYNRLYKNNRIMALGMDFRNTGESFWKKLKKGLRFIIDTEGPWLIHCHAGVDRTGFVSMVLEALMGATVDEIINDYLLSFNSIFDSIVNTGINKKDSLIVMRLLSVMSDSVVITDQNLALVAENYLKNTIRLSGDEVDAIKNKLKGG